MARLMHSSKGSESGASVQSPVCGPRKEDHHPYPPEGACAEHRGGCHRRRRVDRGPAPASCARVRIIPGIAGHADRSPAHASCARVRSRCNGRRVDRGPAHASCARVRIIRASPAASTAARRTQTALAFGPGATQPAPNDGIIILEYESPSQFYPAFRSPQIIATHGPSVPDRMISLAASRKEGIG
jgi:hypothetical protein